MAKSFNLEKSYWTEEDFSIMGWHDSRIHAISFKSTDEPFKSDLLFDIYYIFKWVDPIPPDNLFTFWVGPCTLIFHTVVDLYMDLESGNYLPAEWDILNFELTKTAAHDDTLLYEVHLETNSGDVKFKSTGFEQFVRMAPIHTRGQWLESEERGGISFDKISI